MSCCDRSCTQSEQQRLTAQGKQLNTMVMVKKCPSCGHENRDEANYCLKCGVRTIVPPTRIASGTATTQQPITAGPEAPPRCSFHSYAIASHLCGRCGRVLCRSCARYSSGMVFCPLCWTGPSQSYLLVQGQVVQPPYPLFMSHRYFR